MFVVDPVYNTPSRHSSMYTNQVIALPKSIRNPGNVRKTMRREEESRSSEMKCPRCGRYSLKRRAEKVLCRFCGHELSVGEEARFRLYELLKEDVPGPAAKDGRHS